MSTRAAARGIGMAGVFNAGVLPVARLERLLHSASLSEIQGESCQLDANADVSLLARRAPFAPVVGGGRHGVTGPPTVSPPGAVDLPGLWTPAQRRVESGGRRSGHPQAVGYAELGTMRSRLRHSLLNAWRNEGLRELTGSRDSA